MPSTIRPAALLLFGFNIMAVISYPTLWAGGFYDHQLWGWMLLTLAVITLILPASYRAVVPEADAALFDAWKSNLRKDIPVTEYDGNINDPEFARLCAEGLLALMCQ